MARDKKTDVLGVSTSRGGQFQQLNERITPGARGLSTIFGVAGILHFLRPAVFDSIVPGWVPVSARCATYVSGAAELGLACALRKSHTRSIAGYASAAFLVAVFPANVEMMRRWVLQSRRKAVVSVLRLPLQIPLIYGAWRVGKRNVG
ncbi:hypothetical protein HMPREF1292_00008 [Corynebacterium sp. KPL1995]|nr:hypothetical protein HMPREF1292_00008 [Corynebacterium sp. KPL1995]ERS74956.1 hypothetical protein HMPREF1290_00009 [Corynebacterium sp. KPL1989]MDK8397129.1 hypothetical protein [Corynebacterium pseudodiphtheriticum]